MGLFGVGLWLFVGGFLTLFLFFFFSFLFVSFWTHTTLTNMHSGRDREGSRSRRVVDETCHGLPQDANPDPTLTTITHHRERK